MAKPDFMNKEKVKFINALKVSALLSLVMFVVFMIDLLGNYHLNRLGLGPRDPAGLIGILASPFLHGGWEHLLSNIPAVLALGVALFYFYESLALELLIWQFLMNGLLLWILGQPGTNHIGASGLVYSLAFFLMTSGFIRRNKALTVVSLTIIMLYGSLVWGLFPVQPNVSWEGHFAGFISGIVLALFFRNNGPQNDPIKQWDDSDLDGVNPYWEVEEEEVKQEDKPLVIKYIYRKNSDDEMAN